MKDLHVEHKIDIYYKEGLLSRATTSHDFKNQRSSLTVRLPVAFKENNIDGFLNHEIGTHFLRRHNEAR